MGSLGQLSRNIGILIGFTIGGKLDYQYVPCIFVFIPVIFGLIFVFIPNTPQFLLRKGETEVMIFHPIMCGLKTYHLIVKYLFIFKQKAEKSLKYYKGFRGDSSEEINAFAKEFERLKLIVARQQTEQKFQVSDLRKFSFSN